jgi:hypothetical protein
MTEINGGLIADNLEIQSSVRRAAVDRAVSRRCKAGRRCHAVERVLDEKVRRSERPRTRLCAWRVELVVLRFFQRRLP